MINASQIKTTLDPKALLAKVLAWLDAFPPIYYLVSLNGRFVGVLKEASNGVWEFQPSWEQSQPMARADFASPAAFLNHYEELGLVIRLDHVPFPG